MAVNTLQEFKDAWQITGTDATRDARITAIMNAVQARAEKYLGRTLDAATVSAEDHNYNPGGVYFLRAAPLSSLTSVKFVSTDGSTATLPTTAYRVDLTTGQVQLYSNLALFNLGFDTDTPPTLAQRFRAVRFAYVSTAETNAALKYALLQMAYDLYSQSAVGGMSQRLQSASLGDMAYSFKDSAQLSALDRTYLLPFKTGGVL
jgi:hypothetical protein